MKKEIHKRVDECIHCNACKRKCKFLTKYDICIGDTEKLKELAYHCYLCGECTRVCPKGIDGRGIILDYRKEEVRERKYGLKEEGYRGILLEKKNYLFQNHRKAKGCKTVLFPGCNFPGYYPKTLDKLVKILHKEGIEPYYDCCGKPIEELGLEREAEAILSRLNADFKKRGIEEIILVCPNCFYHFGDKLNVKITTIYEKLKELNIGKKLSTEDYECFFPCPDRENKRWLPQLSPFLLGELTEKKNLQCCGMGGCAFVKEPALSKEMAKDHPKEKKLISYCATCIGQFARFGESEHFLPLILETGEKADYKHSFWNRFKHKFY